jgi:heme O synthase-like polyprenyltransferase
VQGGLSLVISTWQKIFSALVIFGFLLYGGLYALNGVADRFDDAAHEKKKWRPVAHEDISAKHAVMVACIFITVSFLMCVRFFPALVPIWIALLGLNVCYSFFLKKKSLLWGIMIISVTSALRLASGVLLAGASFERLLPLYLLLWMGLLTVVTYKTEFERLNFHRVNLYWLRSASVFVFVFALLFLIMQTDIRIRVATAYFVIHYALIVVMFLAGGKARELVVRGWVN